MAVGVESRHPEREREREGGREGEGERERGRGRERERETVSLRGHDSAGHEDRMISA